MNKPEVLLGMSGGTDSSVAAILLQDAGYKVTGVTFRFYELNNSTAYLDDARELASRLGIELLTFDARDIFKKEIIDYFIKEYLSGNTPVPCTLCNNRLKWPLLARLADERGIPNIATGHYVRKQMIGPYHYITCGKDEEKDQSFFLWGLPQNILSRILLPMGDLTKSEVRSIATKRGFYKTATKKDSIGVCFCPMDYRSFLKRELPKEFIQKGDFLDENGTFLGKHEGYPFYTIGQRRGLGIHLNKAVFVKDILPETNQVVLGSLESLNKKKMLLKDWNLINPSSILEQEDVIVKIRYRKQENRCKVTLREDGLLHVFLFEPLSAIACGQAAAFYRNNVLLGGGIICGAEN